MEADFGVGARIRAARHLAGLDSVPALARKINQRNFGETTLYAIEREERPAHYLELSEIAHACGVPVEFFTADFNRLDEISEDPRQLIAARLARADERSEKRLEGKHEDPQSQPVEDQGP